MTGTWAAVCPHWQRGGGLKDWRGHGRGGVSRGVVA